MARISLAGFKDPVRRPRYLVWTGVALLALAVVVIVGVGATSTYGFCANLCHSVQDDAIAGYDASAHNTVSCISCHEPVAADPVTFLYYKAKAGIIGAYQLYTKTYEVPLNPESALAMNTHHMGSEQCTQCHSLETRVVTPSKGIIIDHAVHEENEVHCTACHNRVAHPEDGFDQMAMVDPETGEPAPKHADWMSMTACFRCHTLTGEAPEGGIEAPGKCSACHPADFDLKPANHKEGGFYPEGHAKLAVAPVDRATGRPVVGSSDAGSESEAGEEHSEEAEEGESGEHEGLSLAPVETLDYCNTCHLDTFCMDCHGMEMPHPEEFKTKTHPSVAASKPEKCDLCHQTSQDGFLFCNSCHHGTKVDWTYDPETPWQTQHAKTVVEKGVQPCLGACHEKQFCVDCHTKLQPLPTSHKANDWLHNELTVTQWGEAAAKPTAVHAVNALKSTEACAVCHGEGGANAGFCRGCHGMDMPHDDQYRQNHVTGAKTPDLCRNCHQFEEICSNCHHAGATTTTDWTRQHPRSVAEAGGAGPCFEKCHEDKQFCVDCHTRLNAVPSSHEAKNWTRNLALGQAAGHSTAYQAATDSCDYCHGTGGVEAKFCQDCHKLPMPHPADFQAQHAADFQAEKYAKTVCENCHNQFFCDNCHHEGAVADTAWRNYHPNLVKKNGLEPCLACHDFATYCEYCHVSILPR